jgi:hypothetical protein
MTAESCNFNLCVRIPNPDETVMACRDDPLSVGRKRDVQNLRVAVIHVNDLFQARSVG